MGYSAKAVANYFLSKYGKSGITPLKLQKLVYLAHGWHLAYFEEPLVGDEYAEAWQYGPVFSSLYHEFKHKGRSPIDGLATDLDWDNLEEVTPRVDKSDKKVRKLLDRVWEVHGRFTGGQLSRMTHKDGSPWAETRKTEGGDRKNSHIPDELIMNYYKKLRDKNE